MQMKKNFKNWVSSIDIMNKNLTELDMTSLIIKKRMNQEQRMY